VAIFILAGERRPVIDDLFCGEERVKRSYAYSATRSVAHELVGCQHSGQSREILRLNNQSLAAETSDHNAFAVWPVRWRNPNPCIAGLRQYLADPVVLHGIEGFSIASMSRTGYGHGSASTR
jgi:hypothetical protein